MYAVFSEGGRQHSVQVGDVIHLDHRDGLAKGQALSLDQVLVLRDGDRCEVGKPHVKGCAVEVEVVEPLHKGVKIRVQKFRRRRNYKKCRGHRQQYTTVKVVRIGGKAN